MDLTAASADTSFSYPRRIYPLSPRELTEEQLAVVFAMTSRRPEPFDEIALQVSQEKAADFHERWVLGYGHASVAEHAVIHMAVENISRLACDSLEDNRLASYTEKSSRFQVMSDGYYHVPKELATFPDAQEVYIKTCQHLFRTYQDAVKRVEEHLRATIERRENERESAYNLRLRRDAIDSCRFLLPAATLTNVGVTMNINLQTAAVFGEQLGTLGHQAWMRDLLWYVDDPGYTGVATFRTGGITNWMGYSNETIDGLIVEMNGTLDEELKAELAREYQRIVSDEAPQLFLADMPFEIAMRDDIHGYVQLPDNLLWYWPLYRE